MNDEHRRIIIRKISSYEQQGNDPQGNSPSPVNRWVALVIMIPVLALLVVLGVFFHYFCCAVFNYCRHFCHAYLVVAP